MTKFYCLLICTVLVACTAKKQQEQESGAVPVTGTWRLIDGTLIEKGDTVVTDYTRNLSFIKIINESHFAFLLHDLNQGKDSAAVFSAGGGTYNLQGNTYTEHLEYCSDRAWEGHDFTFEVTIRNDTLIQKGVEKVEEEGVERMNVERYVKVRN